MTALSARTDHQHLLREVVVDVGGLQGEGGRRIDPRLIMWRLLGLLTHCQQVCVWREH